MTVDNARGSPRRCFAGRRWHHSSSGAGDSLGRAALLLRLPRWRARVPSFSVSPYSGTRHQARQPRPCCVRSVRGEGSRLSGRVVQEDRLLLRPRLSSCLSGGGRRVELSAFHPHISRSGRLSRFPHSPCVCLCVSRSQETRTGGERCLQRPPAALIPSLPGALSNHHHRDTAPPMRGSPNTRLSNTKLLQYTALRSPPLSCPPCFNR